MNHHQLAMKAAQDAVSRAMKAGETDPAKLGKIANDAKANALKAIGGPTQPDLDPQFAAQIASGNIPGLAFGNGPGEEGNGFLPVLMGLGALTTKMEAMQAELDTVKAENVALKEFIHGAPAKGEVAAKAGIVQGLESLQKLVAKAYGIDLAEVTGKAGTETATKTGDADEAAAPKGGGNGNDPAKKTGKDAPLLTFTDAPE